ncbi:hypothetical protein FRC01_004248 [Tulasnella sp. 417]|nr:hypothetical protein FRC01_004248 [Tulasnella sp. 417]
MSWEDVVTGKNPNVTWTSFLKTVCSGTGARKKEARNAAARQALVLMGVLGDTAPDE